MSTQKRKAAQSLELDDSLTSKKSRLQPDAVGPLEREIGAATAKNTDSPIEAQAAGDAGFGAVEEAWNTGRHTPDDQEDAPPFAYQLPRRRAQRQSVLRGPYTEETTGQRSFLPNLDDEANSEHDGSDAITIEALAYLRSVRSEALAMPNLLVAPTAEISVDSDDFDASCSRGFYSDGAYVAAASFGPELPPEPDSSDPNGPTTRTVEPQDAYHNRLRARFEHTRISLRTSTCTILSSFPLNYEFLLDNDPMPALLASMRTDATLALIDEVSTNLNRENISSRLSSWIWALLARLEDVGTLVSKQVSIVRELGKQAVWMSVGFDDERMADASVGLVGEEDGEHGDRHGTDDDKGPSTAAKDDTTEVTDAHAPELGDDGSEAIDIEEREHEPVLPSSETSGESEDHGLHRHNTSSVNSQLATSRPATKATAGAQCEGPYPSANTRATVSMIITVVAEFFGQRDLLEFREVWE